MSDVIELKQWAGKTVTPKDDACMYDAMLGDSGYITGCDLISLGSGQIKIGTGRGVIKGRQFVILEHTINVPLSESEVLPGRVYIHMDLSAADPITIMSETAATLSELVQEDDCNLTNGIYEIELGTYMASTMAISDLTKTIQPVSGYKELREFMDDSMGGCTFSVQSDGAYVTYTPPGGADPVTKKLGSRGDLILYNHGLYEISEDTIASINNKMTNLYASYEDTEQIRLNGTIGSLKCEDYTKITFLPVTPQISSIIFRKYKADGTYVDEIIPATTLTTTAIERNITDAVIVMYSPFCNWSGTGHRTLNVKFSE